MRLLNVFLLMVAAASLGAQQPVPVAEKNPGPADIIMPHITDSKSIEYPCIHNLREWACEYTFATHNVTIGGKTFDIGLTKHIFFMMLSGALVCILLIWTANAHERRTKEIGRPAGFAAGLEAVILYLRNEIRSEEHTSELQSRVDIS